MRQYSEFLERHQIPLYLSAILIGAVGGLTLPTVAPAATSMINPTLALLLYTTFLGVPFAKMSLAMRDWRFLLTIGTVNFVFVPPVVFLLSRMVAHDGALLVGVLFVLLTPCIDYVIVFTGIAGGDTGRLLAGAPLLMLAQLLLLPPYLWLFLGDGVVRAVDLTPFANAFLSLIAAPLMAAGLTQFAATRTRWAGTIMQHFQAAMVPLMMLTLACVVASQVHAVSEHLGSLIRTVPVFLSFAAVMLPIGLGTACLAGLDVSSRKAVAFSGVTRNSLVVLPLVLALPAEFALAPLVVVTQTLVELVVMVALIRIIPGVVRD